MKPRNPTTTGGELDDQSWSLLNRSIFHFEDAWNGGVVPDIAAFLPKANGLLRERILVELIKVDQENRWRRGVCQLIESYLADWPELNARKNALVELLSAECLTRSILGKFPSFGDLRSRFPSICEEVPLARIREEAEHERNRQAPSGRSLAPPASSWQHDAPCGRLIVALPQQYEIRDVLYCHGNGVVYKGFDRERSCEVGIGVSYCEPSAEPLASGLFLREARKLATRCDSGGTVVYDFGNVSDVCYLVAPLGNIGARSECRALIPSRQSREPAMSLLQEDQVIRGTYEVERLLGEGAFAEVYRVKHRFLGRQAMKVFKMVGMTIAETEEMLGEALVLSRIGHPNIVRVFDANVTDTSRGLCGFFTMEYVAGGSLDRFWRSHGDRLVPIQTTIDLIRQVCRGLAVAHREKPPLVHRDIKPQNILVGYEPDGLRARVSDFGLAKHVNPLTLLASARGTPSFKAPEVFKDPQSDSCAGDVWAIGSSLYLLLTDRLPYGGEMGLLDPKCFERPLIPPGRRNIQVDENLDMIVARSLAVDPKERYPNASAILEDLEQWRPRPKTTNHLASTESWEASKSVLGTWSPGNETEAKKAVAKAIGLAHGVNALCEAADLLEEALNKWPGLRSEYQDQLKLWRRGISM